ncbi:MAG: hypothetical protein PF545_03625 [Elusimicrobia bacterium]|jgi:DNA/RNA endonuclease YhcR with UshA esterase domain|nr:hypothetical protein [Elusimicrobiota bacterium]
MNQISKEKPKENSKENNGDGGICPICGYFVGLAPTCTRCGARVEKRIAITVARRIAIFGSILGLILLWYAAILKEPEAIKIGDISATMNNALVEVEGRVTSININEEKNSLKLSISDGTGDGLNVNAINKLNKFREALGEDIPAIKDTVRVVGALNVSQSWGSSMFLSLPSRLKLVEKYTIKDRNIGDITSNDEGDLYRITVAVKEYEKLTTNSGYVLNKFVLGDNTGDIEMVLFSTDFESLAKEVRYVITKPGSRFRMLVDVSTYRDEPQVKISDPSNPDNIEILSSAGGKMPEDIPEDIPEDLKEREASKLSSADIGNAYKVSARVKEVGLGGEGVYLTLDGTDIQIFISYSQQEKINNFDKLNDGGEIQAPMKLVSSDYGPELRLTDVNSAVVK